ncbi:MAG: BspA family leucine-rich repeat surface protein [Candidatus Gastranaerophilaceae bacterium]
MSKTWKKLVSVGCATCLLVSCIPETGIALAAETGVETQSEEAATSGTWGTCEWNLDEDGVLTISGGVGESIRDGSPWYSVRNSIKKAVITGKITFKENTWLDRVFNSESLTEIQGLENMDTHNVTNMSGMFSGCKGLKKLDVSGLDTSNVKDMSEMFYACGSLEELNVSGFNTSNVTNMAGMFYECSSLKDLDVSGFDTSNVTEMEYMFYECESLTKLDIGNFDTSKAEVMANMFDGCINVTELNLKKFDMSNVQNMDMIFDDCNFESVVMPEKLNFIDENSEQSFVYYLRSEGLKLGKWKNVTTNEEYDNLPDSVMAGQTYQYVGETVISGTWGTSEWTLQSGEMTITGGTLDSIEKDGRPWSQYARDIKKIVFQGDILFQEETSLDVLFGHMRNVEAIEGLNHFDTSNITNMSAMFYACEKLESLDVSSFDTSKVTNMSTMFAICPKLTKLDVSRFDTSNVTNMYSMFWDCGVTELDLSSFDVSNVSWIKGIFDDMDLSRVVLPKNMGEQESDFITELQKGMKPGSWYDVTADIVYEGLPDTMQVGHEYINKDTYMTKENKNTGITIKSVGNQIFDEEIELITGNVSTDSNFSIYAEAADKLGKENLLYNIYLQKDGEVIQPDGQVQVSIPLPEGMRENAKVYYIAEDGTAIDMNAEYMDGNLVFVTDHFSVYAVVNSSVLSGDIDGNGKVNLQDSALLRRYLAGWDVTIDKNAADVDGNGKVNLQDSALLRRYLAGWDVTLR